MCVQIVRNKDDNYDKSYKKVHHWIDQTIIILEMNLFYGNFISFSRSVNTPNFSY